MMSLKRSLVTFGRIAKSGLHNILRNAWLTMAATAVMVVTLTIVLGGVILNIAFNDTIDDIAQEITLSVYLQDGVEAKKRLQLTAALEGHPNVSGVDYIDKDSALALFEERYRDNPELLDGLLVAGNQLPESLEVTVYDLTNFEEVHAIAKQSAFDEIVEDTSLDKSEDREESIDNIAGFQDFVQKASFISGAIFAAISILIIFNTIRMAIYTRSYEIEIMKLIGATPGYIRGPFLFEASLYGIVAGVIAYALGYSIILGLGPKVESYLKVDRTYEIFTEYWYVVLACTVGLGLLIGYISSIIAMSRYLRIKKW